MVLVLALLLVVVVVEDMPDEMIAVVVPLSNGLAVDLQETGVVEYIPACCILDEEYVDLILCCGWVEPHVMGWLRVFT